MVLGRPPHRVEIAAVAPGKTTASPGRAMAVSGDRRPTQRDGMDATIWGDFGCPLTRLAAHRVGSSHRD